ncbi:MAG: glycosyltransferase family 4 protein, partial [Eubacteriales bacterium]|nr:glycosyltransferase family 4 protein [Eubacteriales bacterium]
MNILVLNYEFPPLGGGAASVSYDLALEMAEKGHKVTVVTMGYLGLPAYEKLGETGKDERGRAGKCGYAEVYRVKCLRGKEHSCRPWEQLTYILSAEVFLNKHLKKNRYDVCHVHFIVPTGLAALWVKKNYGIPCIVTAHGSDVEGHNRKWSMRAMHWMLRPVSRRIARESVVTVPSENLLRRLKMRIPEAGYVLIPNGLRTKLFRAVRGEKRHIILLMSRLQPGKNVRTALKAFAMIPEEIRKDWNVIILGDGPQRENLEKYAKKLGIGERVVFRGWIGHGSPEHRKILRTASVYISCSRFENCPMSVL